MRKEIQLERPTITGPPTAIFEADAEGDLSDLLLEQIGFVEEEYDGGEGEPDAVADGLEQAKRLD